MKNLLVLLLITLSTAVAAIADVPRPDKAPKRSIETTMTIHLKHDATEAKLIIPKDQIRQLRSQLDDLDSGSDTAASLSPGVSRTQTIVGGSLLSLALVVGGLFFARSGKGPGSKTVAGIILIAIASSAATLVYANAGPPAEARSITGKMFSPAVHMYGFGTGRIKLETTDEDTNIDLIVPDPKPSAGEDE